MAYIEAEILKEAIPKPAAGPAGFDVHYEIKDGAEINSGTASVDAQLNEQSLASARVHNEGGSNKEIAALTPPKPAVGSALSFIDGQRAKADTMFQNMVDKHGLGPVMERGMLHGRRRDHRAALSPDAITKNPLMRVKQRRLLQLRKTFDEIAANRKKAAAVNPEMLPQPAKDKMICAALEKGEQNTPFGHIENLSPTVKMLSKAAHLMRSSYNKWEAVGALAGGSYIDLAPRPKRS